MSPTCGFLRDHHRPVVQPHVGRDGGAVAQGASPLLQCDAAGRVAHAVVRLQPVFLDGRRPASQTAASVVVHSLNPTLNPKS